MQMLTTIIANIVGPNSVGGCCRVLVAVFRQSQQVPTMLGVTLAIHGQWIMATIYWNLIDLSMETMGSAHARVQHYWASHSKACNIVVLHFSDHETKKCWDFLAPKFEVFKTSHNNIKQHFHMHVTCWAQKRISVCVGLNWMMHKSAELIWKSHT